MRVLQSLFRAVLPASSHKYEKCHAGKPISVTQRPTCVTYVQHMYVPICAVYWKLMFYLASENVCCWLCLKCELLTPGWLCKRCYLTDTTKLIKPANSVWWRFLFLFLRLKVTCWYCRELSVCFKTVAVLPLSCVLLRLVRSSLANLAVTKPLP